MCGSMADIQSATAEIRRGKKKERKKEVTTGQKYNGLNKDDLKIESTLSRTNHRQNKIKDVSLT